MHFVGVQKTNTDEQSNRRKKNSEQQNKLGESRERMREGLVEIKQR